MTAGENLVQRYWFDGECTEKEYCNEVTIKNVNFLSWRYFNFRYDRENSGEKDFEADLLFIVKD